MINHGLPYGWTILSKPWFNHSSTMVLLGRGWSYYIYYIRLLHRRLSPPSSGVDHASHCVTASCRLPPKQLNNRWRRREIDDVTLGAQLAESESRSDSDDVTVYRVLVPAVHVDADRSQVPSVDQALQGPHPARLVKRHPQPARSAHVRPPRRQHVSTRRLHGVKRSGRGVTGSRAAAVHLRAGGQSTVQWGPERRGNTAA